MCLTASKHSFVSYHFPGLAVVYSVHNIQFASHTFLVTETASYLNDVNSNSETRWLTNSTTTYTNRARWGHWSTRRLGRARVQSRWLWPLASGCSSLKPGNCNGRLVPSLGSPPCARKQQLHENHTVIIFTILKIFSPIPQIPRVGELGFVAEIHLGIEKFQHGLSGNIRSQFPRVPHTCGVSLHLIENQLAGDIFCVEKDTTVGCERRDAESWSVKCCLTTHPVLSERRWSPPHPWWPGAGPPRSWE